MFQIDLTASGDLKLIMPTGCCVEISSTPTGLAYVKQVIYQHKQGIRNQPGYIGTLPTQHAVNKFLANKAKDIAKEKKDELVAKASKLGVDLSAMEINL